MSYQVLFEYCFGYEFKLKHHVNCYEKNCGSQVHLISCLFPSLSFFPFLSRTASPECFDFDSFALSNIVYIMCIYIIIFHFCMLTAYNFSFSDQKAGSLCPKYKLVGTNIPMPSRQVPCKSTCAWFIT